VTAQEHRRVLAQVQVGCGCVQVRVLACFAAGAVAGYGLTGTRYRGLLGLRWSVSGDSPGKLSTMRGAAGDRNPAARLCVAGTGHRAGPWLIAR
jgi:hypothetical protein